MSDLAFPDSQPWSKAAYPVWALVSGYAGEQRRKRRLVMITTYSDDSGTGGPKLVMASVSATAERWAAFSDDWAAELVANKPVGHLKMAEAFSLTGQFNGFLPDERDAKLTALVAVLDKHAMVGTACIIDDAAYRKVFSGRPAATMDHPYFHGCMQTIEMVMEAFEYLSGNDKIDFVFDRMNPKIFLDVLLNG